MNTRERVRDGSEIHVCTQSYTRSIYKTAITFSCTPFVAGKETDMHLELDREKEAVTQSLSLVYTLYHCRLFFSSTLWHIDLILEIEEYLRHI